MTGADDLTEAVLCAELLSRCAEDQRIRRRAQADRRGSRLSEDVAAEWRRVDADNTRWLGAIVRERGWPGRTMVGEDGARAAWLLSQHADQEPALQQAFLEALRAAVAAGEALPEHLAYLEDRVRVRAGQPQLYGTQFTLTGQGFRPCPVEDPQNLDERRAAMGLEPFASYAARFTSTP